MDPVTLGAIISGGAALASGGASIAANANLNKKNRLWQEKMVREQRQREDEVYASRYSPSAQSQAMASAGLNPYSGNTQTMNVGTSSSVPTPASTPLDFSSIGQAGQAIASGLHAREAMKLQREQFNQSVTNDTRKFLIELKQLNLSEQETDAMIKSKEEEIRGMKLKNDIEELNLTMLQEFKNAGGNTYVDAHNLTQAQTDYTKAQKEYQDLQAQIAKEQSEYQKKVLEAQAKALEAQAKQSYANAILASAQAEVAKSSKIKLDNDVKLANNDEARKQAMHLLEVAEQTLINQGLQSENIKKHFEAERERISQGHVENLNDVGNYVLWTIQSFIPFAPTPHY